MKKICQVNLSNGSVHGKRSVSVGLAENEDERFAASSFISERFQGLLGSKDVNEMVGGSTEILYAETGGRVVGALKILQPPKAPMATKLPVHNILDYEDPVKIRNIKNEDKAYSTPLCVEDFDEKLPSIPTIFLLYAATLYCEQSGIQLLYVYVPQYVRRVYEPTGVPIHYTIYKLDKQAEIEYAMRGRSTGQQDPVYVAYGLTAEMKKFFDYLLRHAAFLQTDDWKIFEMDEKKYTDYARMLKIPPAPKM